eukprot:39117-Prymnesium_polylepis.2
MPPKDTGPQMTQLTTEEEWAKVCGDSAEKDVLYFVEVFAAWCGPSDAITSTFRRLKMDLEGRKIKFVQARAHPRWQRPIARPSAARPTERRLSMPDRRRSAPTSPMFCPNTRIRRGHTSSSSKRVRALPWRRAR